jgi:hypothetical protein
MMILFRKYLYDPTEDVRVATETILSDFLREIKDITVVSKRGEEKAKQELDEKAQEQSLHAPEHEDGDQEEFHPDDEDQDRDTGGTLVLCLFHCRHVYTLILQLGSPGREYALIILRLWKF